MAKNIPLYNMLYKVYTSRGASSLVAAFSAAQDMYESGHGESNVAKQNTNYGGIKWAGQKGATKGTKSPEGNHYAKFNNIAAYVDAKIHELKKAPGRPWNAVNYNDYIDGLVKNRYFTDNRDRYANNLASIFKMYTDVSPGVLYSKKVERNIFEKPNPTDDALIRAQADEDVRTGVIETQKREFEAQRKADGEVPFFEDLFDGDGLTLMSKKNKNTLITAGLLLFGGILVINLTRR